MNTPNGYRAAHVILGDSERLPAFLPTDGRHWNGFALPIFDVAALAEHREILASIFPDEPDNEDAPVLSWVGDRPSVIYPEWPDVDEVHDVVIDGAAFVGIGGGFVWEEWDADADA